MMNMAETITPYTTSTSQRGLRVENLSVTVDAAAAIVVSPLPVDGMTGAFTVVNTHVSNTITFKVYQSGKANPASVLTTPTDWVQVGSDQAIAASASLNVPFGNRYRHVCATAISSGAGSVVHFTLHVAGV
jgi:hypothetical protein